MTLNANGFELHTNFLAEQAVRSINAEIEALASAVAKHGIRNAEKKLSSVGKLVTSPLFVEKASCYVSGTPIVARVILFDKTPDKNWLVTWHQDKTISVNNKQAIDGWGPWTIKDGVHHVQPNNAVLDNMITLRVHLDDANERNGCLKVIPNTHRLGILKQIEIDEIVQGTTAHICEAECGDLLVMKPLLLHSSSKGCSPKRRRILHVEYSGSTLPHGLEWA